METLIKIFEAGDPSTVYNVFNEKEEGMKQGSGTHTPLFVYDKNDNIFGIPRMNIRDDCTDMTYVPAERLTGRSSIIPKEFEEYVEKSI